MKYCSENNKRLIHFSTCEVYGKTIGSFLPKDHPLRQVWLFFTLIMSFCVKRIKKLCYFYSDTLTEDGFRNLI